MENKTTNLIEWTVEDIWREIKKTFNKDIAKKFEDKNYELKIGKSANSISWNFAQFSLKISFN